MLMPLAPISAVPARLTAPVLFSVTVELLAAIEEFSSPAAVTLSIWLSRRGLLFVGCFRLALAIGSAANQNRSGNESANHFIHL